MITLIALVLAFFLIKPYLVALISGVVIALILYPLYLRLLHRTKNSNTTGIIVVVIIFLLLLIPIGYMIKSFGKESYYVYNVFRQKLGHQSFIIPECTDSWICEFIAPIRNFFLSAETQFYLKNVSTKINSAIFDYTTNFILRLPTILLQVGVFLFSLFYFLRDGKKILKYVSDFIPLDVVHQHHLFKKTRDTISAIVFGNFLTAILQGIMGGIIFWIFGFSAPLFWGVLLFVLSLVPVLPWLIFAPAGFYFILEGLAIGSNLLIFKGLLLWAFGVIVVSVMDGLFKPYIIGTRAKMPNLIVILGLVGGIQWFGFIGLFIGPIILTALLSIFEIFHEIKHKRSK